MLPESCDLDYKGFNGSVIKTFCWTLTCCHGSMEALWFIILVYDFLHNLSGPGENDFAQ